MVSRLPFKDPERAKQYNTEYHRGWNERNRERLNARLQIWREKNRDKQKAATKRYYEKHGDEIRDRQRMYRLENPEKRRESLRKSGIKRRYERKIHFIEMLGGKCAKCGYNKCMAALDFHHLNPEEKENGFEYRLVGFEQKIKDGKIQLLCANCHREENWEQKEKARLKELGLV